MSRPWLATGVVEAPVDAVFAALLAFGPAAGTQHNSPSAATGADADRVLRYRAPVGDSGYVAAIEVDPKEHSLAVQGNWWYRGVYTVRACPRGSLIEYRVHNVAPRGRWAVPLMQRRLPRQMDRDLAALLQTIGRHLDRPAYPNPDRSAAQRRTEEPARFSATAVLQPAVVVQHRPPAQDSTR